MSKRNIHISYFQFIAKTITLINKVVVDKVVQKRSRTDFRTTETLKNSC